MMTYQGLPSTLAPRPLITETMIRPQMLTLREFRPFKTADEYLWAMKEDLSDWLNTMYPELGINPQTFMECLETGVALCKHANNVRIACLEWLQVGGKLPKCWGKEWKLPSGEVTFNAHATSETFFARDNVHNFITWCRKLGIFECLLFESDDLILRKNEKNVILCLLEVARRGSHFGMTTPLLVQFEKEIDRDIAKDTGQELSSSGEEEESSSYIEYGPVQQIVTNDLRSLDEMVRELVERCTCPTQFPMIRISEGKYRIGNTKVMIYVRILRSHVMVRVGGGWDTLAHYLDKHDPCRCSSGHRATVASKFFMNKPISASGTPSSDIVTPPRMKVEYESGHEKNQLFSKPDYNSLRRDLPIEPVSSGSPGFNAAGKKHVDLSDSGSEISDEGYKTSDNMASVNNNSAQLPHHHQHHHHYGVSPASDLRQHHRDKYYASGLLRSRPGSTDEDRPDSRLTDEESSVTFSSSVSATQPSSKILNSSSASRVSDKLGGVTRSPSSSLLQRATSKTNSKDSGTFPRRTGPVTPSTSARTTTKTSSSFAPTTRPTRSLSAGGSREFYGRGSSSSGTSTPVWGTPKAQRSTRAGGFGGGGGGGGMVSATSSHQLNGKNTWNGCNSLNRPRVRTNLFKTDNLSIISATSNKSSSVSGSGSGGDTAENLDLAYLIRTALELPSDEDKISHIELALKQLEEKEQQFSRNSHNAPQLSNGSELASLPLPYTNSRRRSSGCASSTTTTGYNLSRSNSYSSNNYLEDLSFLSTTTPPTPSSTTSSNLTSTPLSIKKRNDNGLTKIPKPVFY